MTASVISWAVGAALILVGCGGVAHASRDGDNNHAGEWLLAVAVIFLGALCWRVA